MFQKRERRAKAVLSMMQDRRHRRTIEGYGIDDINEILSKNDYQSPEESDPDNEPNTSVESKKVFVYQLSWRFKRVSHNNSTCILVYIH